MVNPSPTIGRIVLYTSYGTPGGEYLPEARAAIITQVQAACGTEDSCGGRDCPHIDLAVFNPTGVFFNVWVPHAPDDKPTPGHWNWPPRDD